MSAEKSSAAVSEKDTVDYNAKAKIIYLLTEKERKDFKGDSAKVLPWEGNPFGVRDEETGNYPSKEEVDEFLQKHRKDINHGDLLTGLGFERATGYHFVLYDENLGKYTAIINPDESGSGYLTIPAKILKNVTNAMEKYEEIFEDDNTNYLNMHISPKDEFIKERLGEEVPAEWKIDLHMEEGEVQEAYIKICDSEEWQDFDVEDSSIESIQALFHNKGDKASFTVAVELKDEKFEAYKKKYGKERAKYGWMHEKPILPSKWMAEKGVSSGGTTHMEWQWIFSGPKESVEAARKAVDSFLEGFTHSYKDGKGEKKD